MYPSFCNDMPTFFCFVCFCLFVCLLYALRYLLFYIRIFVSYLGLDAHSLMSAHRLQTNLTIASHYLPTDSEPVTLEALASGADTPTNSLLP